MRTSHVERRHRREDPEQRRPRRRQALAARARGVAAATSSTGGRRWARSASRSDDVYLRTAISVDDRRLGALRLREDARLPLGHLPRRAQQADRTHRLRRPHAASRSGRKSRASTATRCAASSSPRATPSRPASSSSACSARPRPSALRPAQPLPGERRGGPPPLGDGLPAPLATSAATAARRPRRCSQRRSGDADKPRILGAFNEPSHDWLSFFMFTFFTDRDGKFQLLALAESGFDPLARTTRFMLTEEAHHMFVGETRRPARRRARVRADEAGRRTATSRAAGRHRSADDAEVPEPLVLALARPLRRRDLVERGDFFAAGLKGRAKEDRYDDHKALERHLRDGRAARRQASCAKTCRCATR